MHRARKKEDAGRGCHRKTAQRDDAVGDDADERIHRIDATADCAKHARAIARDQGREECVDECRLDIAEHGVAQAKRRAGLARDQLPAQSANECLCERKQSGQEGGAIADLAQAFTDRAHIDEIECPRQYRPACRQGEGEFQQPAMPRHGLRGLRIGGCHRGGPGRAVHVGFFEHS